MITPILDGSILDGITRKSAIYLLKSKGFSVEERKISIDEVTEAHRKGLLQEVFGTGTAAVISPVGELLYQEHHMIINQNEIGPVAQDLYQTITDIQWGRIEGPSNWSIKI